MKRLISILPLFPVLFFIIPSLCQGEIEEKSDESSAIILLNEPLSEQELDQWLKEIPDLQRQFQFEKIFPGFSVTGRTEAMRQLEKDARVLHVFPSTVHELQYVFGNEKADRNQEFLYEHALQTIKKWVGNKEDGGVPFVSENNGQINGTPFRPSQQPNHFQFIGVDQIQKMTDEDGEKLTGKGIKIGIIDTGIDYTHPDLVSNYEKGYDFIDQDDDPQEKDVGTIHGTHVAGIIAANGRMTGIAPEARLYVYRALGPRGRGTTEQILAAIEQAIKDQVDILNLSLGIQINGPDLPTSLALDAVVRKGIVAVVSSGNAGPELWTVGSPGAANQAISVGASTPPLKIPYLEYRQSFFRLTPIKNLGKWSFNRSYPIFIEKESEKEKEDAFIDSLVLLEKGNVSLSQKIEKLVKRNVKGAMITGFEEEELRRYMEAVDGRIPLSIYVIGKKEGEELKKLIKGKSLARLVWRREEDVLANFSSRGPVPSTWDIKPDILAPGVSITSTVPGGYDTLHGTSMAAPHVTGACALIKQAHPNWTPEQIKAALMNTSKPLIKNEKFYRTFEQGAGRIQVDQALRTTTIVQPGAIRFGKTIGVEGEKKTVTLTVENVSKKPIRYTFQPPARQNTVIWDFPLPFYLNPGEKRKIDLSIQFKEKQTPGKMYDGYIRMYAGQQLIQIPYLYLINEPNYPRMMFFSINNEKKEGWIRYEVYLPGGAEQFGIFLFDPVTGRMTHLFKTDREMKKGLSEGSVNIQKDLSPGVYLAVAYAKQKGKEDYWQQWVEIGEMDG